MQNRRSRPESWAEHTSDHPRKYRLAVQPREWDFAWAKHATDTGVAGTFLTNIAPALNAILRGL